MTTNTTNANVCPECLSNFRAMSPSSSYRELCRDPWHDEPAPALPGRHTPEFLLLVAKNTLIPQDTKKRTALLELIGALEAPDEPAPQQPQSEAVKSSGQSPQTTPPRDTSAASGPTPCEHGIYSNRVCEICAEVIPLRRELAEAKGETPCCQEWHTCTKRCSPLAENWRMSSINAEARAEAAERQRDELQSEYAAYREKNEHDAQVELSSAHDHIERIKKERDELQKQLDSMSDVASAAVPLTHELQARIDAAAKQEPVMWQLYDKNGIVIWQHPHRNDPTEWLGDPNGKSMLEHYNKGFPNEAPFYFKPLYAAPPLSHPAEIDAERHKRAQECAGKIIREYRNRVFPNWQETQNRFAQIILEVMK